MITIRRSDERGGGDFGWLSPFSVLCGVGLCLGVLLLLKAPNYVSSQYQEVAVWANLSFLVCLIVALAINLWGTGRLLLSLWRERDQMLPARQH